MEEKENEENKEEEDEERRVKSHERRHGKEEQQDEMFDLEEKELKKGTKQKEIGTRSHRNSSVHPYLFTVLISKPGCRSQF